MLPVLGPFLVGLWGFIAFVVHLGLLVIMIIAMVKAFTGARWDIPFIGPIARKQMGEACLTVGTAISRALDPNSNRGFETAHAAQRASIQVLSRASSFTTISVNTNS